MHRYDKNGLICEPHPSRMPWYIIAGMSAVTAVSAAIHFSNSSNEPACPAAAVNPQEIVEGACNHPVPKP